MSLALEKYYSEVLTKFSSIPPTFSSPARQENPINPTLPFRGLSDEPCTIESATRKMHM